MLTDMAYGDSGTATDSSNIGCTVGSFVGGAIGSIAGPAVSEQSAALCATLGGAISGNGKQINLQLRKSLAK
jgi:outer membrane lipoprotein SlyB